VEPQAGQFSVGARGDRDHGHGGGRFEVVLDRAIPEIEPPEDTEFVKHVRMRSELLSEFWGEDVYLGAHVLLPKDFDEHPEARFPLMVFHGHFPKTIGDFRTEPPDPDLEPEYSERFDIDGYNLIQQQEAYNNYLQWISDDFPRFPRDRDPAPDALLRRLLRREHGEPGALRRRDQQELIPFIEERFQGIGEGWARFTYGGSTGGWEAMATQLFYPDMFNGAFIACPDPIDFRAYLTMNIYEDSNAYYYDSEFQKVLRPGTAITSATWTSASRPTTTSSGSSATATAPASSSISGRRPSRRWTRTATRRSLGSGHG
jgi:hypothetical protein